MLNIYDLAYIGFEISTPNWPESIKKHYICRKTRFSSEDAYAT